MSHKATAIGGWDNSNELVNSLAIFWYVLIGTPLFMQRFYLGLWLTTPHTELYNRALA